jgi:hypothetical protein
MEFLVGLAVIIIAITAVSVWHREQRRKALMAKYGDAALVKALMEKRVWQGMTQEQLVDSQGRPAAIDEQVYKTKTKRTFKYNQDGKNRYATRIVVENGFVVGWTDR